ncbi:MAG TPA: phosphoribosylaminoimidazolesuccinocarboxamide synthase [Firmicutes bacterium]|nr:phosphoribosylaminoimidazolesuccinocarboxamide synthase [Bacillota bacterium]
MELVIRGKTKDVFQLADGNYLLQFKDDLTGTDGTFDPGADSVGLTVKGAGRAALRLSKYFFTLLAEKEIPTHYIEADLDQLTMTVKRAVPFGHGLEVICRYRAVGSFYRRYGKYIKEGEPLNAFVEFTLKDDEREDPPITEEALQMLGILSFAEYRLLTDLTRRISGIVREELARKDIELCDIKLEFGRLETGQIILIDEISGGNLRAVRRGESVDPLALADLICR